MCEMNDATPAASVVTTAFITGLLHWNITDDPWSSRLFSVKYSDVDVLQWDWWRKTPQVHLRGSMLRGTTTHWLTDSHWRHTEPPTRKQHAAFARVWTTRTAITALLIRLQSLAEETLLYIEFSRQSSRLVCVPECTRFPCGCSAINVDVTTWEIRE